MKVKCVSDCCGDFWDITVGQEYEVLEYDPKYPLYKINGVKITEERYAIIDDTAEEYSYPTECFEIV